MQHSDDLYLPPTIGGPLFDLPSPFEHSPHTPTEAEAEVAKYIWTQRGRHQTISIARLQQLTGFGERMIKGIVEELVVKHRLPIGARRDDPVGYFVIEDSEDLEVATGPYRAQILAMWRRLRALDRADRMAELRDKLTLGE